MFANIYCYPMYYTLKLAEVWSFILLVILLALIPQLEEPSRPPMDLFKAIFAESSESSDSDTDTDLTSKTAAESRTTADSRAAMETSRITESRTTDHGRQRHDRGTVKSSQKDKRSDDGLQKRWQDFSVIVNRPAAAPSEAQPHLSLHRAPPRREIDPATRRQRTQVETRRDGQKERSVTERDGGAKDRAEMQTEKLAYGPALPSQGMYSIRYCILVEIPFTHYQANMKLAL